ncbi:MAG: hypothetical protein BJ554DRAFT_4618, partial [Olpidium bornovanus]
MTDDAAERVTMLREEDPLPEGRERNGGERDAGRADGSVSSFADVPDRQEDEAARAARWDGRPDDDPDPERQRERGPRSAGRPEETFRAEEAAGPAEIVGVVEGVRPPPQPPGVVRARRAAAAAAADPRPARAGGSPGVGAAAEAAGRSAGPGRPGARLPAPPDRRGRRASPAPGGRRDGGVAVVRRSAEEACQDLQDARRVRGPGPLRPAPEAGAQGAGPPVPRAPGPAAEAASAPAAPGLLPPGGESADPSVPMSSLPAPGGKTNTSLPRSDQNPAGRSTGGTATKDKACRILAELSRVITMQRLYEGLPEPREEARPHAVQNVEAARTTLPVSETERSPHREADGVEGLPRISAEAGEPRASLALHPPPDPSAESTAGGVRGGGFRTENDLQDEGRRRAASARRRGPSPHPRRRTTAAPRRADAAAAASSAQGRTASSSRAPDAGPPPCPPSLPPPPPPPSAARRIFTAPSALFARPISPPPAARPRHSEGNSLRPREQEIRALRVRVDTQAAALLAAADAVADARRRAEAWRTRYERCLAEKAAAAPGDDSAAARGASSSPFPGRGGPRRKGKADPEHKAASPLVRNILAEAAYAAHPAAPARGRGFSE